MSGLFFAIYFNVYFFVAFCQNQWKNNFILRTLMLRDQKNKYVIYEFCVLFHQYICVGPQYLTLTQVFTASVKVDSRSVLLPMR